MKELAKHWEQWGKNPKETLYKRLENLCQLYYNHPKESFPFSLKIFGFPELKIGHKEELLFRIKELEDILNVKVYKEEE